MKKRILTALLASAMILSVAGCDSATDTGAGDTTTTTAADAGAAGRADAGGRNRTSGVACRIYRGVPRVSARPA